MACLPGVICQSGWEYWRKDGKRGHTYRCLELLEPGAACVVPGPKIAFVLAAEQFTDPSYHNINGSLHYAVYFLFYAVHGLIGSFLHVPPYGHVGGREGDENTPYASVHQMHDGDS